MGNAAKDSLNNGVRFLCGFKLSCCCARKGERRRTARSTCVPRPCASLPAITGNYGAIKFNEKRETKSVIPEWARGTAAEEQKGQLAVPGFFCAGPIKILIKKNVGVPVSRHTLKQLTLYLENLLVHIY